MRLFDPSLYFTRKQADARYLQSPQTPPAPSIGQFDATPSEVYTEDRQQVALLRVPVDIPAKPDWVLDTVPQWIQGVEIEIEIGDQLRHFYFTGGLAGNYRVQPLPCGVSVRARAALIDYLGQRSQVSAWSAPILLAKDTIPPAAPVISGLVLEQGALILLDALNVEDDFSHYTLQRNGGSGWEDHFNFTGVEAQDRFVEADGNFSYRVQAWDFSDNASTSNVYGPVALKATSIAAPAAVALDKTGTGCKANSDGTNLIKWAASADPRLHHYRVYRRKTGSTGWGLLRDNIVAASYLDAEALDGVSYDYAVSVVNALFDESALSDVVTLATSDTTAPLPIPDPATGSITFQGSLGEVRVLWTSSPTTTVRYYELRYRMTAAAPWSTVAAIEGNSYAICGLIKYNSNPQVPPTASELANNFEVEIVACENSSLKSTARTHVVELPELSTYVPADGVAPTAPTWDATPNVVNKDGSIEIRFNASVSPDRYGYIIERYDSKSAAWCYRTTIIDSTAGLKIYKEAGLEAYSVSGITYQFRVTCVDNSGMVSTALTSGALAAADTTPPKNYATGLAVTAGVGSFNLAWTNPNAATAYAGWTTGQSEKDFNQATWEVWRRTSAPAGKAHGWKKIAELPAASDGSEVRYTDNDPDETTAWTSRFALRVRDRYNNCFGQGVTPANDDSNMATAFLAGQPGFSNSQLATDIGLIRGDGAYPGAVAAPTITQNADGTLTVNWLEAATAPRNDLAGYNIWRRRHDVGGNGEKIAAVTAAAGSGARSWTDSPSVDYSWDYAITGFDTALEEQATKNWSGGTQPVDNRIPDITGCSITALANFGRIDFQWTPIPGAVKYEVRVRDYRVSDGGNPNGWAEVMYPVTQNSFTLPVLDGKTKTWLQNNAYIYVRGVNRSGVVSQFIYRISWAGTFFNGQDYVSCPLTDAELTNYIPMDTVKPPAPANITADGDYYGNIMVKWDYNGATEPIDLNYFVLEFTNDIYATGEAGAGTVKPNAFWQALGIVPAGSYTVESTIKKWGYRLTGLRRYAETGTKYHFRVWAMDNSSLLSVASKQTSVPSLIPTDVTAPDTLAVPVNSMMVPPGGAATVAVTINWAASTASDLFQYEMKYWRADGQGNAEVVMLPKDQLTRTLNLAGGISWCIAVRAVDIWGNRADWGSCNVLTTAVPGPPPPVITKPATPAAPTPSWDDTNAQGIITFAYDKVGQGVSSFKIQRCTGSTEGTYTDYGTCTASPFYDTGNLQSSTGARYYWYRVIAVKADGTSSDPSTGTRLTVPRYYIDPGDTCPATEMYVRRQLKAGEVKEGMFVKGVTDDWANPVPKKWKVRKNSIHLEHCVRLTAENGAEVIVSVTTPVVLKNGTVVKAPEMEGQEILTDVGQGLEWSKCHVSPAGYRPVAHIALGGHVFRAGVTPDKWVYTHNMSLPSQPSTK